MSGLFHQQARLQWVFLKEATTVMSCSFPMFSPGRIVVVLNHTPPPPPLCSLSILLTDSLLSVALDLIHHFRIIDQHGHPQVKHVNIL